MWGPFVGGNVGESDRWWKPVIYRLLKNVFLNTFCPLFWQTVKLSGCKFGTTLAIRLHPLTGISSILFSFVHAEKIKRMGRAIKASLGKKAPKGTGALAGLQAGVPRLCRPAREGRRRDPYPAGQVQRPRARAALPAGHFQPDQPAAPRGGGASAVPGGAARAASKGLTAGAGRGAQRARQPVPPARPSPQQ